MGGMPPFCGSVRLLCPQVRLQICHEALVEALARRYALPFAEQRSAMYDSRNRSARYEDKSAIRGLARHALAFSGPNVSDGIHPTPFGTPVLADILIQAPLWNERAGMLCNDCV